MDELDAYVAKAMADPAFAAAYEAAGQGGTEAGQPTQWDIAFREGYARGLEQAKGITYREAWLQASKVLTQNSLGEWVPDIPLPLYGLRKRCTCGRKFWTAAGYRSHYALRHILHLT